MKPREKFSLEAIERSEASSSKEGSEGKEKQRGVQGQCGPVDHRKKWTLGPSIPRAVEVSGIGLQEGQQAGQQAGHCEAASAVRVGGGS